MKKIFLALGALVVFGLLATDRVAAREGVVELSGSDVSCEGISLWKERNYRVTGRCQGLVYPYKTQYEHYVLWAKTDGNAEFVRVGEIDRGYFDGNVNSAFGTLAVTAETDGLPRRPSELQIASGTVSGFEFAKDEGGTAVESQTAPTAESAGEEESMTVQGEAVGADSAGSTVGSVIGKIVRSLLVIIAVAVVLVVGTSLIFRRRGSVSG